MACFFIGTPWGDDGVSTHFRIIASELAARGHQVVILTGSQDAQGAPHANITVLRWPSPRPTRPRDFLFLARLIRRYRPDCLIANFGAGNVMMLVGWLMRVPQRVIWYRTILRAILRDTDTSTWKNRLLIARKKWIYRLATWVVANSAAAKADVEAAYGVPAHKTLTFYNLVEDPMADQTQAAGGARPDRVLCVGRLLDNKGQDVIIRALALLRDEYPTLTVDFIGTGPNREPLVELARAQGVLDRCRFVGQVPHGAVFGRMREAWFTLVPSRSESLARVAVESLSVGAPVIATRVDGNLEVMRDGVEGWLFPPDDPAALAERMRWILRDANCRETMSRNARQRFLSTFEQSVGRDRLVSWLEAQVSPHTADGA